MPWQKRLRTFPNSRVKCGAGWLTEPALLETPDGPGGIGRDESVNSGKSPPRLLPARSSSTARRRGARSQRGEESAEGQHASAALDILISRAAPVLRASTLLTFLLSDSVGLSPESPKSRADPALSDDRAMSVVGCFRRGWGAQPRALILST